MRFQDGCENDMTLNQLTVVILYKIPVEEEPEVTTIPEITDETFPLEKGYCHGVYVFYISIIWTVLIGRRSIRTRTQILIRRIWKM